MSKPEEGHIPTPRQRQLIELTPGEWMQALIDAQERRDKLQGEVWGDEDALKAKRQKLREAQKAVEELLEPSVMPHPATIRPAGKRK